MYLSYLILPWSKSVLKIFHPTNIVPVMDNNEICLYNFKALLQLFSLITVLKTFAEVFTMSLWKQTLKIQNCLGLVRNEVRLLKSLEKLKRTVLEFS